jgi:hypothetical protein
VGLVDPRTGNRPVAVCQAQKGTQRGRELQSCGVPDTAAHT